MTRKYTHGEILSMILEDHKLTQHKLAKMANIPPTTMSGLKNTRWMKGEPIEKICNALNMQEYEFYAYPYKEELPHHLPPWISEEQSHVLKSLSELDKDAQAHIWNIVRELIAVLKK